ncbi:sensor histidine kinase [Lysobacter terrae]
MSTVRLPTVSELLFWGSLVASILVVTVLLRYTEPPEAGCLAEVGEKMENGQSRQLPFPVVITPYQRQERRVTLYKQLVYGKVPKKPQAIFLENAAPYLRASLNGVDLTPDVDLSRGDVRILGPQLIPFAGDLLHGGGNNLVLELPLSDSLGEVRLEALCVGDYEALNPIYQANWWRQVGTARVCLVLLLMMALLTLGMWFLREGRQALYWYWAILALMFLWISYTAFGWKPGGVMLHRFIADSSLGVILWAMSQLISHLWRAPMPALQRVLILCAAGSALIWLSRSLFGYQGSSLFYAASLIQVACAIAPLYCCRSRIDERMFGRELRALYWANYLSVGCGVVDVAILMTSRDWHLGLAYAISATVIAGALLFVMMRRIVLGLEILRHSSSALGVDTHLLLDRASPDLAQRLLSELSRRGANDERQRLLRDIHDGFGSRLVGVLGALRRGGTGADLYNGVHRALLDMRIMVDALDEGADTLDVALAMLRYRTEPMLESSGIASTWKLDRVGSVRIVDRRRLLQLLRCIEEVVGNAIQHSRANAVVFEGCADGKTLTIKVTDDGCGLKRPHARGQGLKNIDHRIRTLGGTWTIRPGPDATGTQVELLLPYV